MTPITEVEEILPILEKVKKTNRGLIVFSPDCREEPLSTLVYNNRKDSIQCAAVNIPWANGAELEILRDIAA